MDVCEDRGNGWGGLVGGLTAREEQACEGGAHAGGADFI